MRYVFRLPDVGEGIHEAELVEYTVKVGDTVQSDQELLSVETDKAVVALPSPVTGKVLELPVKPGDVVAVGDALAVLEAADAAQEPAAESKVTVPEKKEAVRPPQPLADIPVQPYKRVLATPHTRHLARELSVDIEKIKGTGKRGRVTDDDVRLASQHKPPKSPVIPRASAVEHEASTIGFDFEKYGPTRREPLKGIRKRIAEVMVRSWSTIPHVTHTDEADVTGLLNTIREQKLWAEEQGVKLTMTAFIGKAVISALKAFPQVNSSLDEETGEIVYKDYYHLGIATDTENGLMVPVVRNADQLSVLELAGHIQELSGQARSRQIDLEGLRGGTFTITNIGALGGIHATPIIQHPQVAILGVMKAVKKPVVINDEVVIRTMMPLVVAFDHRLLDGAEMARFMTHIVTRLQDPVRMLIEP